MRVVFHSLVTNAYSATPLFVASTVRGMNCSYSLRVLGVCELLGLVAEQLSYRDLAMFAQVVRVISGRCLCILWKRLPAAFPLLACVPSLIKSNGRFVRTSIYMICYYSNTLHT